MNVVALAVEVTGPAGLDGDEAVVAAVVGSHHIAAGRFVTRHFDLDQFAEAYDVFARAADTGALKVVLTRNG